jgi:hypothetical protein
MSVQIFHERRSGCEYWLRLEEDGLFHYHWQNHAPRPRLAGLEDYNETLTFERALAKFPRYAALIRAAKEGMIPR